MNVHRWQRWMHSLLLLLQERQPAFFNIED
jgi:hypothetical protein